MFFHIVLERNMQLHPRHFGRNLRDNIVAKLMKDVEGTCRFSLFTKQKKAIQLRSTKQNSKGLELKTNSVEGD
ncbi:dna-directed rna polymerase ii subunit rpb7 [Quercus suber]|uniref:Dna-directed rna polymerase ii subunit rpb7 n=1 Tax=Quercus suber TaxID=58331 RepID=A0AAW0LH64_QUESU